MGINLLPSKIGKPGKKGGNVTYSRLLNDVYLRLKNDKASYCTTLLDYYGLKKKFPGKLLLNNNTHFEDKAQQIVKSIITKISPKLGNAITRFIPYFQMYEFEGLLFSQPDLLANSLGKPALAQEFTKIRNKFTSPEEINDSPQTSPSKRIEKLFVGYDKPNHPVLAAKDIGLATIRKECKLFDKWLKELEALAIKGGQTKR